MSTVSVEYNHRATALPVSANTILKSVRDDACQEFQLPANEFALACFGRVMDLNSQFDGAVPKNATLELVPLAETSNYIMVKLRYINGNFSGSFKPSATTSDVLCSAGLSGVVRLPTGEAVGNIPLSTLNPTQNKLLLVFQDAKKFRSLQSSTAKNTPTSLGPNVHSIQPYGVEDTSSSTFKQIASNTASAANSASSTTSLASRLATDEEKSMNPAQFRVYLNHLRSMASPQMISQSSKETMRAQPTATIVRVKFPDNTFVTLNFPTGASGADLYTQVRSYLVNQQMEFELYSVAPKFTLSENDVLVKRLGARAVLLVSTKCAGPYLANGLDESTQERAALQTEERKEKKLNSVPKWMRLHK